MDDFPSSQAPFTRGISQPYLTGEGFEALNDSAMALEVRVAQLSGESISLKAALVRNQSLGEE